MNQKKGGIPMVDWSGSGATNELHNTIKEFNESATRQTEKIVILTWVITVLTFLLFIGLVVQIYLVLEN